MRKRSIKRRNNCYLIFFILTFNIISIVFFPGINFNVKNNDNLMDDPNSLIHTSSSGPPDNHFFQY
ncbi:MAG: hypothetical protein ACFFCY_13980, partial [Promethearchaeota archaeon]